MRILLLTETIPYPFDSGGRIKTYHTLRMLACEHDVHCHAFIRRSEQRAFLPRLEEVCASVTLDLLPRTPWRELAYATRSVLVGIPYLVLRHLAPASLEAVKELCGRGFDLVYADHLSMMEYARHLDLPIVYDAHNVEYAILRRYADPRRVTLLQPFLAREWRRLREYERVACRRAALVCAVSENDANAIRELAGKSTDVRVIPIAVDADAAQPLLRLTAEPRLLFVGGLHWPPNLDAILHFARDVWPLVRRAVPAAQVTIVGRDDVAAARRLRQTPGFTLAGYVDDVAPHFERSRVMVVPLRAGSGMRVKILDAFARGLPVVSTPTGHEGIDVEPGRHLLSAAEPQAFASEVVRVLGDDRLAGSLAAEARRLVEARYNVPVVGRSLLEALGSVQLGPRDGQR
jgi:glycosyltransferase involved in cell wall biosynthesis